jgi:phosphate transport system substrate-binding protein
MLQKLCSVICLLSLGVLAVDEALAAGADIVGAGATFPAPVIAAWAEQFSHDSGITVSYRPVGSGEGIRRVTARASDFAMTDVPLTQAELVQDDLMQFPVVVGAVAPVVNVPGIGDGEIKLTGKVLADIYLGKIARWNDPVLRDLNPQLALPDLAIAVVHRADGSGTSFVFTYYLSKASAEWQDRLGVGSRLLWPTGIGAEGSEGMSRTVHDTPGAIGYVEYAYALRNSLATARLLNKAGKFVRVDDAGMRAALASARWSRPGYYEMLVDRGCDDCWPIVGISFALIHERQEDGADAAATLSFLHWGYAHGAEAAAALHYVSLDDASLIGRIEASWNEIEDGQGQRVWKNR